jgi:2-dehydro-3-deoxyphosphogluconate aldolase/(4S)-4-hydroxy-2-oxoglutarate aldolase
VDSVFKKISKIGIVPVVVINDAANAEPVAKALYEGGITCAEVTFRTDAAEESIRLMVKAYPQMLVGAGTTLTIDQVQRAVNAGAKFIVSPGLNPKIVQYCLDHQIPVVPGVSNPTDIEVAL